MFEIEGEMDELQTIPLSLSFYRPCSYVVRMINMEGEVGNRYEMVELLTVPYYLLFIDPAHILYG